MDYNDALAFLSSNFDAVVNTFRSPAPSSPVW